MAYFKYLVLLFVVIYVDCEDANGQVDPANDRNTIIKSEDVIIYRDDSFYATFPSVVKKKDGELVVAFRRAPDRREFGETGNFHVDPNSYLVQVSSADNGKTWTKEPKLIYAHAFGGSQDPCLLQLTNGDILCTSYGWAYVRQEGVRHLEKPYSENKPGFIALGGYYLRSRDNGQSWDGPFYPPNLSSEVRKNALGLPIPAMNRGALCESETGKIYWAVAASHDSTHLSKKSVHLLISADQGVSWKYSSTVAQDDKIDFNETSLYETPKGDIVAFMRTANFEDEACIARSEDGGMSFKSWKGMGFKGHPLQAIRLADKRVLLVYGYRHRPYGIRARILNAECTNFDTTEEFVIREDGGSTDIGYPWAVALDDTRVLVTYYFNKDNETRFIAGSILEIK